MGISINKIFVQMNHNSTLHFFPTGNFSIYFGCWNARRLMWRCVCGCIQVYDRKFLICKIFNLLKENAHASAHQMCIYLIKNSNIVVIFS